MKIILTGATGMVGDPSGKSEERNLLSTEVLNYNAASVKKFFQLISAMLLVSA